MRITGGIATGHFVSVPKGLGVRPTPEKVRQAIFNSIQSNIENATVLELFGGSGALSLEALSRGARMAICVEKSPKHARFIKKNFVDCKDLQNLKFEVRLADALNVAVRLKDENYSFDYIFADPQYGEKNDGFRSQSLAQKTVDLIYLPKLLNDGGALWIGHAKRDQISIPNHWIEKKALKHGDNWIRILVPNI